MTADQSRGSGAGATIVTATRRLARWLRESDDRRHVAAGETAWHPLEATSLDAWVDIAWRRVRDWGSPTVRGTLLSDEQERFLWEQAVADIPEAGAILMPGQVAREAQAAWRLVREYLVDREALLATGGQATRHLLRAAAFVEERCREAGWCTGTERMAQLARSQALGDIVGGSLIVDSLDEPRPLQQALLDAIAASGSRVRHRERSVDGAMVVAQPATDPRRELESLAVQARAWIERNPEASVGIVVQDLEMRREEVEVVFDDVLAPDIVLPGRTDRVRPWGLSLGRPLSEWPMVATALRALALCLGEAPFSEMSLLLRAPHIGGDDAELAHRCRLDAWLRARGRFESSIAGIVPGADPDTSPARPGCPDLDSRLARVAEQLPALTGRSGPSEWVSRFTALLGLLGWPGPRALDSAEYQCLDKWQQVLSSVAALGRLSGPMTAAQCLERIRKLANDTVFQPEGPTPPIQVLGLHETAGLVFDALWVAGTHHQAWPRPLRPNALLPVSLQRDRGMPRACAAAELEFARDKTRRLASAADYVCFSWPAVIDDEPMRPSPLVTEFPRLTDLAEPARYDRRIRATSRLVWARDFHLAPVPSGSRLTGGSAALRDQSACPFRSQARHRLRAESLEDPVTGVHPIDSGRIAHLALQWLWQEWGGSERAGEAAGPALRDTVRAVVGRACRLVLAGDDPLAASMQLLERDKVTARIIALLESDLARDAFEVAATEEKGELDIAGVNLRFRIDRVDRLADGGLLLVDYKTGSAHARTWLGERPEEPQLPLYGLAKGEAVRGLAFGCLRVGEERYVGYADREIAGTAITDVAETRRPPDGQTDWDELRALWRVRLERIAAEHASGDARVAPRRVSRDCAWCDLSPLCRRHELAERGMLPDD